MTAMCCPTAGPAKVLRHQVAAPSTLGTFLRAFTFGPVRQPDPPALTPARCYTSAGGPARRTARCPASVAPAPRGRLRSFDEFTARIVGKPVDARGLPTLDP